MNRLWVTGFRSFELGIFNTKDPKLTVIKYALKKILNMKVEDGCEWLLTGGQLGIEQWAIEEALQLKEQQSLNFQIALMVPFLDFGSRWQQNKQERLNELKQSVDFSSSVFQSNYQNPQQLRLYQEFMLKHTESAVIFYDQQAEKSRAKYDYQAMKKFSENHNYPILLVDFDRLQEYADEYQLENADDFDQ